MIWAVACMCGRGQRDAMCVDLHRVDGDEGLER